MTTTLVRRTAKELAGAFFENEDTFREGRYIRSERFRDEYARQQDFVNQHWTAFVKLARKILGHMLTLPGTSQADKDAIYDALLKERGALTDEDMVAPSIIRPN